MMKSSCRWPGHALPNSTYRYNPYMHTSCIHLRVRERPEQIIGSGMSTRAFLPMNTTNFLGFQANYHEQPGTINHLHITPAKMASDDVSSLAVGVKYVSKGEGERDIHVNDVIISAMLTLPKATRCRVHRCSSTSTYRSRQ